MVNPCSAPVLLWSILNASGDTPKGRKERCVILDACLVTTLLPTLVHSGYTISGYPPFERGFELKSSSRKRAEHVFAGSVCLLEVLSCHSFPNLS